MAAAAQGSHVEGDTEAAIQWTLFDYRHTSDSDLYKYVDSNCFRAPRGFGAQRVILKRTDFINLLPSRLCLMSEKLWRRDGARAWAEAYLVDLTAHGLYRLSATASYLPGLARLLWGLLFAGALAYSLRQCATLLSRYQSNELDVSVDFHFNIETVFPAVTICNLNALRSSVVVNSRFHMPSNDSTSASATSTNKTTTSGFVPTGSSSLSPRTTLSTDKTLDPRLLEPTSPPDLHANITSPIVTTPDPEATEPDRTSTQQVANEPSLFPAFTFLTFAAPQTTSQTHVELPTTNNVTVSTSNATGTVPTDRPSAATSDFAADNATTAPTTSELATNQTAAPEEPDGGGGGGSCSLLGLEFAPIPGLSCTLLAALFTSGGAAAPPLPTFAPVVDDFIPEDFFQRDTTGDGPTASDLALDIAESFDENGTDSIFTHVFKQSITVVKIDTTKHKINFDYTEPPVLRDEVRLLGHQLKDMMISCQWEGKPCDESNFTQSQNGRYGNCYTFNSGKNAAVLKTQHVGPSNGLIIELDLEQAKNYIAQLSPAAGLRMTLHQQGEIPFPEDDGFNLPPAHLTYIGIRQVVIERRGAPYSNCFQATTMPGEVRYSKWNCLKSCLAKEMYSACECVDPVFLNLNYSLCHVNVNDTQRQCLSDVNQKFKEDKICFLCPDPCRSVIYRKTLSMERWPSEAYKPIFENKLNALNKSFADQSGTDLRDDYLRFVVYFEEFNYQRVTQQPAIELAGLLSSIGGTLGLYVGMSVLSVAEFIDMLLNMIYFLWEATVKRFRR